VSRRVRTITVVFTPAERNAILGGLLTAAASCIDLKWSVAAKNGYDKLVHARIRERKKDEDLLSFGEEIRIKRECAEEIEANANARDAAEAEVERLNVYGEKREKLLDDTELRAFDEKARADAAETRVAALEKALTVLYDECVVIRLHPERSLRPHPNTMKQAAAALKVKP
jgi:hypothetical protein